MRPASQAIRYGPLNGLLAGVIPPDFGQRGEGSGHHLVHILAKRSTIMSCSPLGLSTWSQCPAFGNSRWTVFPAPSLACDRNRRHKEGQTFHCGCFPGGYWAGGIDGPSRPV